MHLFPVRALERAMKIREVITRAMSGKINWIQAAEILGMSDRQLRRRRNRWSKHGYNGLFDYRTQRPSPKRVPLEEVEKVLTLYREVLRPKRAAFRGKVENRAPDWAHLYSY